MNTLEVRAACLALAEDLLAAELAETGDDVATSARVLSLAAAIHHVVTAWFAAEDEVPS